MKSFLLTLLFVVGSFTCQAQKLPDNWHKMADTAFKQKDYVISIAKGQSAVESFARDSAFAKAKAKAAKIMCKKEIQVKITIDSLEGYYDGVTSTYYLAIKLKKFK